MAGVLLEHIPWLKKLALNYAKNELFLVLRPCRLTGTGGSGSRESNDLTGMGKLNGAFNGLQINMSVCLNSDCVYQPRGRGRGLLVFNSKGKALETRLTSIHQLEKIRLIQRTWLNSQKPNPTDSYSCNLDRKFCQAVSLYASTHVCTPRKSRKYTQRYFNWRTASWFDIFILNLQSVIPKVDDTIKITYEILNSFPLCSIYETRFFSSRRLHYMAIVPIPRIMYATPLDSARFAIPAITLFQRGINFQHHPSRMCDHMDFPPIFSSHSGLQNKFRPYRFPAFKYENRSYFS